MKHIVLCCVVICCMLTAGCGKDPGTPDPATGTTTTAPPAPPPGVLHVDKSRGFQFRHPEGWTVTDDEDQNRVHVLPPAPEGSAAPSADNPNVHHVVIELSVDDSGRTLEQMIQQLPGFLAQSREEFKLIEAKSSSTGVFPDAGQILYDCMVESVPVRARLRFYVFPGNIVMFLTAMSPQEEFDSHAGDFDIILDTVRLARP